ncbi:MAG: A/G-specific adenine glycosylase [Erysipelotrichaceae bacterium]
MKQISPAMVPALLAWYHEVARVLPWRSEPTPYRVWVSEIMLQQTRVETVIPYFERFMEAMPSLEALANASEEQLHKLWEGLGYYSRVRNMATCAKQCMEIHNGALPSKYEELLKLKGIGPYTAGAIASIAFNQPIAAIDGNVLRVFSRLGASEANIALPSTSKQFKTIIEPLIPKDNASAFNQALMELGATICIPNGAPRCNICPLQPYCNGEHAGIAGFLPVKTKAKPRKIEARTILVLTHDHHVFLQKRKASGLLAGLYEFVNLEGTLHNQELEQWLNAHGVHVRNIDVLPPAKHIFSHVEWHMMGYQITLVEKPTLIGVWADKKALASTYSIPTAFSAYRTLLEETL